MCTLLTHSATDGVTSISLVVGNNVPYVGGPTILSRLLIFFQPGIEPKALPTSGKYLTTEIRP